MNFLFINAKYTEEKKILNDYNIRCKYSNKSKLYYKKKLNIFYLKV